MVCHLGLISYSPSRRVAGGGDSLPAAGALVRLARLAGVRAGGPGGERAGRRYVDAVRGRTDFMVVHGVRRCARA